MIGNDYPWGEAFQSRLLAYLLQDPERMYDIVEPQWFASPVLVEISRILKEAYASHGRQTEIPRSTLIELVRATMGESDAWHLYKKAVKELYKITLPDKSILYKQALDFAKESRYRDALIACRSPKFCPPAIST